MYKKLIRNPYLLFLPFLFYYGYIIYKSKWPKLYGDEIRYVDFAKNLLHGFYSPPMPHINLWNGPGYPILLMPFVALHVPDIYITLANAVYQYIAVVFLFKALNLVTTKKAAIITAALLALYPNGLSMLPILYTEAFTVLLVSAFIYTLTLFYVRGKTRHIVLTGLTLGYIILTKIIFGYVILLCLVFCGLCLLFKQKRSTYLSAAKMLAIAFATSLPYLGYTYHLTGKVFYWGDSGGMSLYWMSTPYENEYGDWKMPTLSNKQYPTLFKSAEGVALLRKNHLKEINFILKHNEIEQDELFKKIAIENIKHNPSKFVSNYIYNVSRMLFNFPYSYAYQDGVILKNILTGSFMLWASVLFGAITLLNWRKIIFPVKFILLITAVYLVLSGALSSYPRQLNIVVPCLLFWSAFIVTNLQTYSLKFKDEQNLDDISLVTLQDIGVDTESLVDDASFYKTS